MVVRLFELIGLKIIFDVDLRDVGKTPRCDMDIPSPHQQESWSIRGRCGGNSVDLLNGMPPLSF